MHTSSKKSNWLFKVALVAIGLAVGLWLGVRLTTAAGTIMIQVQRIYQVMTLIQSAYVEEPNLDRLAEGAIEGMLERLDPHSVYIPPADQTRIAEVDEGEFELMWSLPDVVNPGDKEKIRVKFAPNKVAELTATLKIETNAEPAEMQFNFKGYGRTPVSVRDGASYNGFSISNNSPNPCSEMTYINIE